MRQRVVNPGNHHGHFAWSRVLGLLGPFVVAIVAGGSGCSAAVGGPSDGTESSGEVAEAVTGCEVDCANGSKLTCSVTPCSVVNATTLSCNGVTSTCPSSTCVPKTCESAGWECGALADGCGHNIGCGNCFDGELCRGHVCGPR